MLLRQINAGGGSNGDNPNITWLSQILVLVATTLRLLNNAYKFMSGIEGMDRFGTGPIRSSYFMLSSTELQTDFDSLVGSGVINNWDYPNNSSALPSEWGSVFNLEYLLHLKHL